MTSPSGTHPHRPSNSSTIPGSSASHATPASPSQLWLQPEEDGTYAVACIPFMTYGLALGGPVRLSPEARVVEVASTDAERHGRSINLI
ncbi:hypothetical protein [Streptomyces sp. NBC_01262]|uniref:hypothetical protein n=1 Tax=Streptomyces sp. NBC_01262 TaxID=2903803 RepID=UPI002E34B9A6|nr:hypothetical protein [Streptomyces sp. NBC_01262]